MQHHYLCNNCETLRLSSLCNFTPTYELVVCVLEKSQSILDTLVEINVILSSNLSSVSESLQRLPPVVVYHTTQWQNVHILANCNNRLSVVNTEGEMNNANRKDGCLKGRRDWGRLTCTIPAVITTTTNNNINNKTNPASQAITIHISV